MADRVAVVTGAGRGVGAAIARQLSAENWAVVVVDSGVDPDGGGYDPDPAEEVAGQIWQAGGSARPVCADVTTRAGLEFVMETATRLGSPMALVHAAGIVAEQPVPRMTDEAWRSVLAVHLDAAFTISRAFWPLFESVGGGRIVLVGGADGLLGGPGKAAYAASKSGLIGLMRVLAAEGMPVGISANLVLPFAETRLSSSRGAGLAGYPNGAAGARSEDVAPLVAWLCSGTGSAMTGQMLGIRGAELTVWSQPRPVGRIIATEGWTPQAFVPLTHPAMVPLLSPLGREEALLGGEPIPIRWEVPIAGRVLNLSEHRDGLFEETAPGGEARMPDEAEARVSSGAEPIVDFDDAGARTAGAYPVSDYDEPHDHAHGRDVSHEAEREYQAEPERAYRERGQYPTDPYESGSEAPEQAGTVRQTSAYEWSEQRAAAYGGTPDPGPDPGPGSHRPPRHGSKQPAPAAGSPDKHASGASEPGRLEADPLAPDRRKPDRREPEWDATRTHGLGEHSAGRHAPDEQRSGQHGAGHQSPAYRGPVHRGPMHTSPAGAGATAAGGQGQGSAGPDAPSARFEPAEVGDGERPAPAIDPETGQPRPVGPPGLDPNSGGTGTRPEAAPGEDEGPDTPDGGGVGGQEPNDPPASPQAAARPLPGAGAGQYDDEHPVYDGEPYGGSYRGPTGPAGDPYAHGAYSPGGYSPYAYKADPYARDPYAREHYDRDRYQPQRDTSGREASTGPDHGGGDQPADAISASAKSPADPETAAPPPTGAQPDGADPATANPAAAERSRARPAGTPAGPAPAGAPAPAGSAPRAGATPPGTGRSAGQGRPSGPEHPAGPGRPGGGTRQPRASTRQPQGQPPQGQPPPFGRIARPAGPMPGQPPMKGQTPGAMPGEVPGQRASEPRRPGAGAPTDPAGGKPRWQVPTGWQAPADWVPPSGWAPVSGWAPMPPEAGTSTSPPGLIDLSQPQPPRAARRGRAAPPPSSVPPPAPPGSAGAEAAPPRRRGARLGWRRSR